MLRSARSEGAGSTVLSNTNCSPANILCSLGVQSMPYTVRNSSNSLYLANTAFSELNTDFPVERFKISY